MQGVLVYPPFPPYTDRNGRGKLQERISGMDNIQFLRTRYWDNPPAMTPTCYVKPAVKPLYRPHEIQVCSLQPGRHCVEILALKLQRSTHSWQYESTGLDKI